ncbi:uncharacterized protein [Primulina huaijiensis]|uniref:uncharacterized protein n=1 Tax=Primulina huaijiensis TaxID=1492673 RepID=UPI003CC7710C
MHCKYHHRMSRKGYIGLEAELRNKKLVAEDEEVDRSVLWRKAREDKSGNITCSETSEVAEKIDELLEKKGKGEFKSSGINYVLTAALGSQEHYGRVRGVGGFVKPQVYFKTPRKKRETISKAVIENVKAQSEETKSLKAELEMLRSQLAAVIPLINDRSSETVASNKFSGVKDSKLSDDVQEVYDCGTSNTKGKKCHMAVKEHENVVAYGTIISEGGPNVMIHHVPLGEENFKVSIDVVLDEKAQLPIPIKFGPTIINDAIGVIVGWPKELDIFPTTKRKGKPQSFVLADVLGQRDNFKEIEKTLPMSCKYIYYHVVRLLNESDTICIEFEDAMFGRPKSIRLLREDIVRFMEMSARQILVYMGHLYKDLKKKDKADYFSFVDPGNIPTCPIGTDGRDLSQHIADQLEAVCRDSIYLIPYNTGYHWILTIVNEDKNMIYLLDSTSNRNRDDTWKTIVTNGVKMYKCLQGYF